MPPHHISVKSILNKTKRRDPWFLDEYTVNPYSGCSFNCLYCYIRGSKYGFNMAEKVSVKENAAEILAKQLSFRSKKRQFGFIVLASATDPYLHFEKELGLTREILSVIAQFRFPVHIITKSDLVVRDFDLLEKINATAILPADLREILPHKVFVTFSFSTISDEVAKIFEPGATPPSRRLETLRKTSEAKFHTGISLMPLLPWISDTGEHLEQMFRSFKNNGAKYVMPSTITLFGNEPSDSKTLVLRAVEKYYPQLLEKYKTFFGSSNEMPEYYREALRGKMNELCRKYEIPNSILKAARS